jgi:hypothetical protein
MTISVDIVRETLDAVRNQVAAQIGLPEEVERILQAVERDIKRTRAGLRVTVSAVDVPPPVEEIKKLYLANLPIESITSRHGISRATLYRLIKR